MNEPRREVGQEELRALERQCIQECAPPCTAACPIHVDVRVVLEAFANGDDDAALKALRRTLPFPGIIGRICDQPCRPVCKRGDAGDAIAIAAIERACVDFAVAHPAKSRPLPRRSQRVAVVGGGLAGMTAAHDLAGKGYHVTLYEALAPVGGRLWSLPEAQLPRTVLVEDLRVLEERAVDIRSNVRVVGGGATADGQVALAALRAEFDAVYIAVGGAPQAAFGLATDASGRVIIDPVTFATSIDRVFAGGSMLRPAAAYSPITSIADGRRAAVSIDRLLQGVSLTASREGEGSQESCLYTRTDNVAPVPVVASASPDGAYCRLEAQEEARRCLQCECLECVKVCEYLEHYDRYPRKAVREIYNNLSIVKGTRYANRMINSCSLCGLCAEVCPTDLDMGQVISSARQTMVAQERMPLSAHDFALRDMAFSQGEHFALARNAPGTTGSDVVFFPGCQLSGASPEQVLETYGYLASALPEGTRVGLLLGCCGAPAEWAGRRDLAAENVAKLRTSLAELGNPKVVVACSSCHHTFRTSLPDVEVVSLWEVMVERGLPARPGDRAAATTPGTGARPDPAGRTIAIHDACATRHEAALQDSVRTILTQLGYEIEELPRSRNKTTCCGFGGAQWLANREVADKVIARRAAESERDYVAYCAMCRDFLARGGKPTVHLLDLVLGSDFDGRAQEPAHGWSERHENRARLKRRALAAIWGEHMDGPDSGGIGALHVSDAVRQRLEERLILDEDVRRVIAHAEQTGRRLVLANGHFLASHRPAAVTYWVEYSVEDDGYAIHNAYSHRMEIGRGTGDRGTRA